MNQSERRAYQLFNKYTYPEWLDDYITSQKVADILMIPRTSIKEFIYLQHIPFKYFKHILYIRKEVLKELSYIAEKKRYEHFLARDDIPLTGKNIRRNRKACEEYDIPYDKWLDEWGFDYGGISRVVTPLQKSKGKVLRDLTDI